MAIEAIIFDNDGVLVDSEIVYVSTVEKILKNYGIKDEDIDSEFLFSNLGGIGFKNCKKFLQEYFDITLKDDFIQTWQDLANVAFTTTLQPTKGCVDMLEKIPYKIGVASGAARRKTILKHKTTGIDKFIQKNVIFSGEDVSNPKPAPDVFLHAARGMGVNPEKCVAVEDAIAGVKSAKNAGMHVFGFVGGSHISNKKEHSQKLLDAGAIEVFDDMSNLLNLIKNLK